MRIVLFDLGDTLEHDDVLLPGAEETLKAIQTLSDWRNEPVAIALVSDYTDAETLAQATELREEYYSGLDRLGIRPYFEPVATHVTLSTDAGVGKPDPKIFEMAIGKLSPDAHFHQAFFVTENAAHVKAARELGMMAMHFRGPGQTKGEFKSLPELIPIIRQWIAFDPCGKRSGEAAGRVESQVTKSKKADSNIQDLVAKVDIDALRSSVTTLASFGTRWT